MSDLPSLLKSPVSTICQPALPAPAEPPPLLVVPFISQIQTPVPLSCCHTMSDLPSLLKSPVSTICQPALPAPADPPPLLVVPFICQIETSVPLSCCHRMSDLPSLLKAFLILLGGGSGSVVSSKNRAAGPLKGAVNECAVDPPEIVALVTLAPVLTFSHSTLNASPAPAERLTVKVPPVGANAMY